MPIDMTISRRRRGAGFSAIKDAAAQSEAQATVVPTPTPDVTSVAPEKHPLYDDQDGEEEGTGYAQMIHDLGIALQEMMTKDPGTNKSMTDLMEEFMGKGIDYETEGKKLRAQIEARKTPKKPSWIAAGIGSWAGGPQVAGRFEAMREAASSAETAKQKDIEDLSTGLLKAHVEDLRARGKTKEALLMGLMSGMMAQKRTETTEAGKSQRAEELAKLRRELQERALGAAEERVRLHIGARKDVADKDRTAAQVMHLYESLLKQTEKKMTGAVVPLYSAEEAMDLALNTILPKVKPGVEAVKTGKAPVGVEAPTVPPKVTGSKFAQWKAQQATKKGQ